MKNTVSRATRSRATGESKMDDQYIFYAGGREFWTIVFYGKDCISISDITAIQEYGAPTTPENHPCTYHLYTVGHTNTDYGYLITVSGGRAQRLAQSALPKEFTDLFRKHVIEMRAWCPRCRKTVNARHGTAPAYGDRGIRCSGRLTTAIPWRPI